MILPPYGIIKDRLKSGKVIPFLGAGASLAGRPEKTAWNPADPAFLPSGDELAHFLADRATFPSSEPRDRDDLAKVSSYLVDVAGRPQLRDYLHGVFNRSYSVGPLHQYLASLPGPLLIVTTNYDTLLEEAFLRAGKPYDLVVYPSDRKDLANAVLWWPHGASEPKVSVPNKLRIDFSKTTVIYKMHGSVNLKDNSWETYVVTEEDYVEFLSRMTARTAIPACFFDHFLERSFLFLGYGLRDWNLRVVLRNLSKYFSRRAAGEENEEDIVPSWAIQLGPSELERLLWQKRNVTIFDLSLDEFVDGLKT